MYPAVRSTTASMAHPLRARDAHPRTTDWWSLLDGAGLDSRERLVLTALWEADGATDAGLALRAVAPLDLVRQSIAGLQLLGYAEREDEGVWLTADGIGLRERARALVGPVDGGL